MYLVSVIEGREYVPGGELLPGDLSIYASIPPELLFTAIFSCSHSLLSYRHCWFENNSDITVCLIR